MRLAALFLLIAGWAIVLSAIVLFPASALRAGFALSGAMLEALGLVLLFRSHAQPGTETER